MDGAKGQLYSIIEGVRGALLSSTELAVLGEPAGLAGSALPPRGCQASPASHQCSVVMGASENDASISQTQIVASNDSASNFASRLGGRKQPCEPADNIISERCHGGFQAGAVKSADSTPASQTPKRAVKMAFSNSTPQPASQHRDISSPVILASCRTPLQTCRPMRTASFSAEPQGVQSATGEPARLLTPATRTAAGILPEAAALNSAGDTTQRKRMRAAPSPHVLLDMTSSPERSQQHDTKQVLTASKETLKPHQEERPTPKDALGSLRAQLQAAARQAVAAATHEAEQSAAEASQDGQGNAQDVDAQLRRAIIACKRLREEIESVVCHGPEVGDLAAAVELEEPEGATPAPRPPMRMRRVSFNLPEPPRKPKGSSPPASFRFSSISPKKVAPRSRQQPVLKWRSGSLSPHNALRGARLPGSPHHCWARPSTQATLHTAPPQVPAPGQGASCQEDGLEAADEEEGLLNLVRRLSYERPARPPKRARLSLGQVPQVPAKQAPAASTVEQELREAYMNARLAKHWLAGEDWAALDYNGLVLSHAAASAHRAKHTEVLERMTASKGQAAAEQLIEQLEREWQQLRSIRQRYASAPTAVLSGQGCGGAEVRQTPAKSILKRRSLGALQEILNQMPLTEGNDTSNPRVLKFSA